MKTADERLIITLAELLRGKKMDTEAMMKPLKLFCNSFSFDAGMVYEVDHDNLLRLREHCSFQKVIIREQPSIGMLDLEQRKQIIEKGVVYIVESKDNTQMEKDLLQVFSAASVVMVFMADEKAYINGLIAFVNVDKKQPIDDDSFHILSVMMSMFVRYAATRIFQNQLGFAQATYARLLDNTGIDIYVNDFYNHDILYVNKSMAAPYGGVEKFVDKKCWEVLFPDQNGPCEFCPEKKLTDEHGDPTKVYSWDYQRAFDGSWFRVFSAAFRWTDGRLAHVVSSADITDNKKNEELIKYMANYDSLTNLPNRRMLVETCEQRISEASEEGKYYVLFFDIDGFKAINDNFGHDAGDEFLIELGKFFTGMPMLKDSIYRNGGDEFVGLLGGDELTKSDVTNLGNFILQRFENPWHLKTGKVYPGISVGIACYPEDGTTVEELLHKADQAMYQAKKAGGNTICFGFQIE